MISILLVAAAFAFVTAATVLWANPSRLTNQILSCIWTTIATWFILVHKAVHAEVQIGQGIPADVAIWLRRNSMVAAALPFQIWLLKEVVATASERLSIPVRRMLPFLGVSCAMLLLCFSPTFVLPLANSAPHPRGLGYWLYILIELGAYTWLVISSIVQARTLHGIRRLELQLFMLSIGTTCFAATACIGLGNLLLLDALRRSSLVVCLAGFALTAWSITAHRIFDTREIIVALVHRVGLIGVLGMLTVMLHGVLHTFMSSAAALLCSIAPAISLALWLGRKSREWLRLTGEHLLLEMRRAAIDLSRSEPNPDQLILRFEQFLLQQSRASTITLLFDRSAAHEGGSMILAKERPALVALRELGWVTPESVQRRRPTRQLADARALMGEHSLGLLIAVPRGSVSASLIVAFGTKTNKWPFTYPEIARLQNVVELIDNIVTRSRLTAQAALQAKMEHLSMMSRGLAHDLKNLITPVSSFLVHTEGQNPPDSPEAEVHAAAKRSVRIMTEYVREALFFSERLAPRFEYVEVAPLLERVRELTAERAHGRGVRVVTAAGHPHSLSADGVLLQRMLGNLVSNAIDASNPGQQVTLAARNGRAGRIEFRVEDAGTGIPREHLGRIFEPYFTTKEFGEQVRGFGLGLTISKKIIDLHRGNIAVTSQPGQGTTVVVDLPTNQSL